MKSLEPEIKQLLRVFQSNGVLEQVILIGSWATLFFKEYFNRPDYFPSIRTTDIDFLISQKQAIVPEIDISNILVKEGFIEEFQGDGWIIFHKPEFHVEFLMPRVGSQSDVARPVPGLGINARPLRHMWMLCDYLIEIEIENIRVRVPHPAAFALHKMIISLKRKDREKALKDKEQIKSILAVFSDHDREVFEEIKQRLPGKERKLIDRY